MTKLSPEAQEILREANGLRDRAEKVGLEAKRATEGVRDQVARMNAANESMRNELNELKNYVSMPLAADGKPLSSREQLANAIAQRPELATLRDDDRAPTMRFEVPLRAAIHGNDDASGGALRTPHYVPDIIGPGVVPLSIRDLLPKLPAKGNAITYLREIGFESGAGIQSEELAELGQSNATFEEITEPVVTMGHQVRASRQILDDVPTLRRYIAVRLLHGLGQMEEAQLLNGSGVGENLRGLKTLAPQAPLYGVSSQSSVSDVSWQGIHIKNPTRVDIVRIAKCALELAGWLPTGVILNPTDAAMMELEKVDADAYMLQLPSVGQAGPGLNGKIVTLWQMPVVVSAAMPVGEFMVGDFLRGAALFDRETAHVEIGYSAEHGDFVRNALRLKAEQRTALATYVPGAFLRGKY